MQKAAFTVLLSSGLVFGVLASSASFAEPGGLAGSWTGGGTVTFGSGNPERARCRATFSPSGASSYDVSATCATQSGSVSQQAVVHGSGNRYRGTFYNAEWDASGTISIAVSGRSQTVRLTGTKGNAVLTLRR
jgi:hypothetical protein